MKRNLQTGFSLIELMVAVAIVGILAAIAMPSYQSYVIRGSRAAAQTELLKLASMQEKIYLNSSAYSCTVTADYNGRSDGGLGIADRNSDDTKYQFFLDTCATNSYTLSAKPVDTKGQAGDGCLTLQENGQRRWFSADDCTGTTTNW
ncbi:MAG: type IV pilin protein [Gallionella sp.]|nr:type IV pilin protein [Gallionella sp.]